MLAVHRLLGDTEPGGDLLPGPSQRPRVADLEHLQPFGEYPQRRHRAQPNPRVVAGGTLGEFQRLLHSRQHKLTAMEVSTYADDSAAWTPDGCAPGRSACGDLRCPRNSQPLIVQRSAWLSNLAAG